MSRTVGPSVMKAMMRISAPHRGHTSGKYRHAGFDHYFVTWITAEIAILDAGTAIKGWERTGRTFQMVPTARAGTSPVCRF